MKSFLKKPKGRKINIGKIDVSFNVHIPNINDPNASEWYTVETCIPPQTVHAVKRKKGVKPESPRNHRALDRLAHSMTSPADWPPSE
jgi:hypothetical protein